MADIKVGDKIRIILMGGEPQYTGAEGVVTNIDDWGQIHGTWGGCAIIPDQDIYEILETAPQKENVPQNTLDDGIAQFFEEKHQDTSNDVDNVKLFQITLENGWSTIMGATSAKDAQLGALTFSNMFHSPIIAFECLDEDEDIGHDNILPELEDEDIEDPGDDDIGI